MNFKIQQPSAYHKLISYSQIIQYLNDCKLFDETKIDNYLNETLMLKFKNKEDLQRLVKYEISKLLDSVDDVQRLKPISNPYKRRKIDI